MFALTILIHSNTGSPRHTDQRRRRNKRHLNLKRRTKIIIICRWHDTLYREAKYPTKKLELINEFNKVAGYKMNIQKSVAFLHINNELSEIETKTIPSKNKIKHFGIDSTKGVKNL